MIVLATGYHNDYNYFPPDVQQRLKVQPDGLYLYRHIIPPRVPGLAYVGSEVFTMEGVLTAGLQSEWLGQLLSGRMKLPSVEEQEVDVEALKEYKRSWMLPSKKRSSFIGLHGLYYHDQILRDLGYPTYIHGWNLLAELFTPVTTPKYSHIFHNSAQGKSPIPPRQIINRPRHPVKGEEKVEMLDDLPYGGVDATKFIEKGIMGRPKCGKAT
eukprot:jgi/Botrbrau1/20117/Bobra.0173s0020.1